MIEILGNPKSGCDGVTRRDALSAGGLSLFGLTLPQVLAAEAAGKANRDRQGVTPPPRGKAKSVILLFLFGGPSHLDTWDVKPEAPAEVRGPFKPISSSLPGVPFCEHLPRMAQLAHKGALIRTLTHPVNDHSQGVLATMTGSVASDREVNARPHDWPNPGAVCQYLGMGERDLPGYIFLPIQLGKGQRLVRPGPYAGWLGKRHDPLFSDCVLSNKTDAKYSFPYIPTGKVVLPGFDAPTITVDRLNKRRTLIRQLEDNLRAHDKTGASGLFTEHQQRAFDLMTSSRLRDAFDVSKEPESLQDRYGRSLYGNATLVARRLVEAGARFVTVTWEVFEYPSIDQDAWDTHVRNFDILKDNLLPVLDAAYATLIEDLEARGLLDETLVICMGEMGRTPKINSRAGRDHWSYCFPAMLCGAGVKPGVVYGRSDAQGAYPAEDAVQCKDFVATLYHLLGLDPDLQIPDALGRPTGITMGGKAIAGVLA